MGKGKYKKKNTNATNQSNKQHPKNKNAENSSKNQTTKTLPKFKLHVMDIVTIIFTAIIIGIMLFVVYDQFSKTNDTNSNNSSLPTTSASATATATATPAPTLSDIGNIYGNITNDSAVAKINNREYFISNDDNGKSHIYVNIGNETKDLLQTQARSLSVVTDYITYADQVDVTSYYVFYINSDGNICYAKDGPVGASLAECTNVDEVLFLEGNYVSIDVSSEYVYHLNKDGIIGKTNILTKESTTISKKRNYSDFVLYYGTIYAKGTEDSLIYTIPTTASKSKEDCIINTPCDKFVLDNNLIYTINKDGIFRYSTSGADMKETLSDVKANAINVYKDSIFYIANGNLYTCSASSLLTQKATKICKTSSDIINITLNTIYIKDKDNNLYKLSYDNDSGKYSEPVKMK